MVVVAALAGPARAAIPASVHLGAEAITDFPLEVGGRLWTELPHRLRLSAALGYLPGGYVDGINAILVGVGAYDQQTADTIRAALQSSLVFRAHAGWRPFTRRGFYFEVGYGLVTLGGGLSGAKALSLATGLGIPPGVDGNRSYTVESRLHMIDAELGWQWLLWRGLSLRAALGFSGTLGSSTAIASKDGASAGPFEDSFMRSGESYLNDTYKSYVFTPVASLGLGWRFF